MHYIRFLKVPRVEAGKTKGSGIISALFTITTDLGESHLLRNQSITATLRTVSGKTIGSSSPQWTAGMRSLKIEFQVHLAVIDRAGMELEVAGASSCANDLSADVQEPAVVAACSAVVNPGAPHEEGEGKFVQRRLSLAREKQLTVWEETGESIARHIWDGGLALAGYISKLCAQRQDRGYVLPTFDELLMSNGHLDVLEIGAGCGIVGMALASLRMGVSMILTDLPLARPIVSKNLETLSIPSTNMVGFRVLDWDEELPKAVKEQSFDVFLVADCMYNADAAPALVDTITRLMEKSPAALLVVAHKERHDAESEFFKLMEAFELVEQTRVPFGQDSFEEETFVDLYTYRCGARRA